MSDDKTKGQVGTSAPETEVVMELGVLLEALIRRRAWAIIQRAIEAGGAGAVGGLCARAEDGTGSVQFHGKIFDFQSVVIIRL